MLHTRDHQFGGITVKKIRILIAALISVALLTLAAGQAEAATSARDSPLRPPAVDLGGKALQVSTSPVRPIAWSSAVRAMAPTTTASVVVPAAKRSDWWYAVAVSPSGSLRTVVNVRYSWSWMWWLRDHMDTVQGLTSAACGLLVDAKLVAACGAVVTLYFSSMKGKINQGLRAKKCLQVREPAPPVADYSLVRLDLVTCRI